MFRDRLKNPLPGGRSRRGAPRGGWGSPDTLLGPETTDPCPPVGPVWDSGGGGPLVRVVGVLLPRLVVGCGV
jgi:hypothetical protein